jgi:hypothetical protein
MRWLCAWREGLAAMISLSTRLLLLLQGIVSWPVFVFHVILRFQRCSAFCPPVLRILWHFVTDPDLDPWLMAPDPDPDLFVRASSPGQSLSSMSSLGSRDVQHSWHFETHLDPDWDPWILTLDYGSGSGSCSFCQWLSRWQQKYIFLHINFVL